MATTDITTETNYDGNQIEGVYSFSNGTKLSVETGSAITTTTITLPDDGEQPMPDPGFNSSLKVTKDGGKTSWDLKTRDVSIKFTVRTDSDHPTRVYIDYDSYTPKPGTPKFFDVKGGIPENLEGFSEKAAVHAHFNNLGFFNRVLQGEELQQVHKAIIQHAKDNPLVAFDLDLDHLAEKKSHAASVAGGR